MRPNNATNPITTLTPVLQTVHQLQSHFGTAPQVAVLLGSGWGGFPQHLKNTRSVPYTELAAFAPSGVEGHTGALMVGHIDAERVVVLSGRRHTYEDDDCTSMAGAIQSLQTWGVQVLVLTNAAGSLRPAILPGSLMLISDHINAPQRSPLVGESGNTRFVDMAGAYDQALRMRAHRVAVQQQILLTDGIYLWALGPQFETPAEVRMFAAWGADAVGMSTVPESILARYCGLRVLGLSVITNMAAGLSAEVLSHEATLSQALASEAQAVSFLRALLLDLLSD
jgi:purine-nucleoside phosphorylase